MSKEQLPMELEQKMFDALFIDGTSTEREICAGYAAACARIAIQYAKEEMEKEAVAFEEWKLKNKCVSYGKNKWYINVTKSKLADGPFTITDLYLIFKTPTESKNK